jgi:hypothetical protein
LLVGCSAPFGRPDADSWLALPIGFAPLHGNPVCPIDHFGACHCWKSLLV